MTDIPTQRRRDPKVWRLALPDWESLDTVWKRRLPFALWQVGEQALLFHWLDSAVDQDTEKIELLVVDRPVEVRQQIANAALWPIEIEVRSVPAVKSGDIDDIVDRLPGTPALNQAPADGWALIQHWFRLEQDWLVQFAEDTKRYGDYAAIGRNCKIAPNVKLKPPFWIGDFVSIGPGCVIGPGAVIEDGSILSNGNQVKRGHVGAYTYVGPEIDIIDAAIHKNELINFKHQAHVYNLESFVAGGLHSEQKSKGASPKLHDRWMALKLYLKWTASGYSSDGTFQDLKGIQRPALSDHSIHARRPWLKEVALGRLELFGVTPRSQAAVDGISEDWRAILEDAPAGAFSYADVIGVHEVGSREETLHTVYQTGINHERCRELFDNWLQKLD